MTRQFVEVRILADLRLHEVFIATLGQLGFEGFWEDGDVLKAYISAPRWSSSMEEEMRSVLALLTPAGTSPLPRLSVDTILEENWNDEWEKTVLPVAVGERFLIRPSWHNLPSPTDRIALIIDPKMSFGTGYHESTRLVLRLMERLAPLSGRLLDVGTGTGILAIAGLKLGAGSAVGVDVDEWAYENARENALLNEVAGSLEVRAGDLGAVPESGFDIILANLQLNILISMLPDLARKLTPSGTLILSGLLLQDETEIHRALSSCDLRLTDELRENEWLALACRRTR
jgi:ribosomal protein L11 methyltransferase